MAVRKEMVLYYTPEKSADDQKRKGVLVRLGIRIRNIAPEQAGQQVGYLAGLPGFAEQVCPAPEAGAEEQTGEQTGEQTEGPQTEPLVIPERMLVFCGFTERGIGELLSQFRRAKLPPVPMKAVLTEHNSGWSFYRLYQELRREHEAMSAGKTAEKTAEHTEAGRAD